MRTLSVAAAPRPDSSRWPQRDPMSWPELVSWLGLDRPADKKECGGYVLGELADERRRKDTVQSRSAVALDADYASPSFVADSAAELGCALAFYTTWRHSPEKPRWRLLAPLSRDVTPGEYRLIAGAMMVELGFEQFDTGSTQPERFMFRPSSRGFYEHHVIAGDPLDADGWLARAKELGIEDEPQPEPYLDTGPARSPADGLHPYAARAIASELGKLDALPYPWHRDSFWDQTTFNVACNLVEFANSNWSGYTFDAAQADLFEHAPSDEAWGADQHAAKWLSALNRIGNGARPCPDDQPGDVFEPVPPDGVPAAFQRLSLWELLDPDRPPREYVVEPMLATGTSVALVAPAGSRKSLILLRIALAVARGEDSFAGMPIPRARRVLYLDMENTEDDLRERLESFGVQQDATPNNFILVHLPPMDPLDTAKGGADLCAAVDAYGLVSGDLVVLDSYQRVTQAGENDSDTTRGYYRHTGTHLKSRGLTVVRTDNTGKDVSRGARGSSGKRDDVDVEYLLRPDGDYVEVMVGKARQRGVSELSLHVIQKDGQTTFRSDLSPTMNQIQLCVAALDALGVPDRIGYRKASQLLEDDPHLFSRDVCRDACKQRQSRGRRAADDFGESSG